MEKYYTIHFEAETGENFDDGVFMSKKDACTSKRFNYPGYGVISVKEINKKDAEEILTCIIDDRVKYWLDDDAVELDPESSLVDERWLKEANEFVADKEPGWQLLQEMIS